MRTARATPPESVALATTEPSVQAATLSGWPSRRAAMSRISAGFQRRPSIRSAIATPATNAAALDPRPLPSGISLSISSASGGRVSPTSRATASAVCQIRLSSAVEIFSTSRPRVWITSFSARSNRHVRYKPSATPSVSKPGPRLALDPGTRTRIDFTLHPCSRPAGAINCIHHFASAIAVLTVGERATALGDGLAEVQELAFKRRERGGHRIARAGFHTVLDRGLFAGIVLNVPGGELVARDHRGSLGAVNLHPLTIAGPECSRGLNDAGGARWILQERRDHVLGLDFVERAELPVTENFRYAAHEPDQQIHLVDGLCDQRASALHRPASFDRPRVIGRSPVPLYISVRLHDLAEPAGVESAPHELRRFVEAMLAHNTQ